MKRLFIFLSVIFSINGVSTTQAQTLVYQAPEKYPGVLALRGTEGWVLVEYGINKKGRTKDIKVLASYPHDEFHKTAKKTIKKYRYDTRQDNGEALEFEGLKRVLTYCLGEGYVEPRPQVCLGGEDRKAFFEGMK